MKTKRKFFFMGLLASLFFLSSYVYANDIDWRDPAIYKNKATIKRFIPRKDGFDIHISNNNSSVFWYIQIISDDIINIENEEYELVFEYNSTKNFALYSRFGDENVNEGNSYKDINWPIIGDGQWHRIRYGFLNSRENNFLYFQIGGAPSGTTFKIRNIVFQKVK